MRRREGRELRRREGRMWGGGKGKNRVRGGIRTERGKWTLVKHWAGLTSNQKN